MSSKRKLLNSESEAKRRLSSENQINKISLCFYLKDFIERYPESAICPSDIKTVTDKYIEWNACYSKLTRADKDFSYKVMSYIAHSMYRSCFKDSSYVELVLRFLFEKNGNMADIFVPAQNPVLSSLHVKRADFAEYFLDHAYRRKALFDGYRLPCAISLSRSWISENEILQTISLPIERPILLQILKFGGIFSYCINYLKIQEVDHSNNVIGYLLFLIICKIVELNPELLPIKDVKCVDNDRLLYEIYVSSCELVLKEFSMWSLYELHERLHNEQCNNLEKCCESVKDFIRKFSVNVIDDFESHFITILSLKQISRLVIRRKLNRNWALPAGIYQLPIPETLKVYLDVQ